MATYVKKPVIINAYKTDSPLIIHTLEGDIKAEVGDWIITGVDGEEYPCKPDIFERTYSPVTVRNPSESPVGKWENFRYNDFFMTVSAQCNNCGKRISASGVLMPDCCPNCGSTIKNQDNNYRRHHYTRVENESPHWIIKKELIRSPFANNYICSKCRYESNKMTTYCPGCGEKLR